MNSTNILTGQSEDQSLCLIFNYISPEAIIGKKIILKS